MPSRSPPERRERGRGPQPFGTTRRAYRTASGVTSARTGTAQSQVASLVAQIEEIAGRHPDAAAYRPGDVL